MAASSLYASMVCFTSLTWLMSIFSRCTPMPPLLKVISLLQPQFENFSKLSL